LGRPKVLFITEHDTLYPPEDAVDPSDAEAVKEKKKRDALKKKEEDENGPKTYLHHKY
jgi:hypothetical protein